jgi:hypothetical protein
MKVINLFRHIKKVANIEDNFELELADLNGEIKNLNENFKINANAILKERETYVLLRIESRRIFFQLVQLVP